MDGALLTFFLSMIFSALAVVVIDAIRKPKIRKPVDSYSDKPVSIGF